MRYIAPSPEVREQFHQGQNARAYEMLGAHPVEDGNGSLWHFAVWAPNAESVSLVGDFNAWNLDATPMEKQFDGIWEIRLDEDCLGAVPGKQVLYKYAVRGADGQLRLHADPCGFAMQARPDSASILCRLDAYPWTDQSYREDRKRARWATSPVSIYEVSPYAFLSGMDREAQEASCERLIAYVKEMSFTHLELMPVMEHLLDESWGYEIIGYYALSARYGNADTIRYLVNRCHAEDIGVIFDIAPAHFPKDEAGLRMFDGTHLYDHPDPRRSEAQRWDTLLFDLARGEVRSFLMSAICFWIEWFHADGMRIDSVSSMVYHDFDKGENAWLPNVYGGRENLEGISFLQQLNIHVHKQYPGVLMIAEETQAYPGVTRSVYEGGLGFDMKWNQGWTSDIMSYMQLPVSQRRWHHDKLTFSLYYAFSEAFILPFSHDESGKKSLYMQVEGDAQTKYAQLRTLYGYWIAHPGKKLMFMLDEWGTREPWHIQSKVCYEAGDCPPLARAVRDLNRLYRTLPSLYEVDDSWAGFQWLQANDSDNSVFAFLRWDRSGHAILCVSNFGDRGNPVYRLGLPVGGTLTELFSTDDTAYGGSGEWKNPRIVASREAWREFRYSAELRLPPMATLLLRFDRKE